MTAFEEVLWTVVIAGGVLFVSASASVSGLAGFFGAMGVVLMLIATIGLVR